MKSSHPHSIRFSDRERAWLERESARRGVAVSEVVREAIRHEMANLAASDRLDSIDTRLAEMQSLLARDLEAIGKVAMRTLKMVEATK